MKHGDKFPSDWKESAPPPRSGLPWTSEERGHMCKMFMEGRNLRFMCEALQRPAAGTLAKLVSIGLLDVETDRSYRRTYTYRVVPGPTEQPNPQPPTEESEQPMSQKIIEVRTFILGADAQNMTDGQIIAQIEKLQASLTRLTSIKAKSVKIAKLRQDTQADIDALIAYLDSRDPV